MVNPKGVGGVRHIGVHCCWFVVGVYVCTWDFVWQPGNARADAAEVSLMREITLEFVYSQGDMVFKVVTGFVALVALSLFG